MFTDWSLVSHYREKAYLKILWDLFSNIQHGRYQNKHQNQQKNITNYHHHQINDMSQF